MRSETVETDPMTRGGEEVLLDVGGQDATEAFEDVGHSDEAREILDGLKVGSLKRVVRPKAYSTFSQSHCDYEFAPLPLSLGEYT